MHYGYGIHSQIKPGGVRSIVMDGRVNPFTPSANNTTAVNKLNFVSAFSIYKLVYSRVRAFRTSQCLDKCNREPTGTDFFPEVKSSSSKRWMMPNTVLRKRAEVGENAINLENQATRTLTLFRP